jgi:benzoate membrane transport protein
VSVLKDVSASALVAGFLTVLVGFTSSAVIVFQAASTFGATPAQAASWIMALTVLKGLVTIVLSLRYRAPVVLAWSTPGAALLISAGAGVPMSDAIGAFLISGVLITIAGFSGLFERAMNRIPMAIASGVLAGVLLRFGLGAFDALKTSLWMVLAMLGAYLLLRRLQPRYAVIGALLAGVGVALLQRTLHFEDVRLAVAQPIFVMPGFSLQSLISIAIPLFVVTMASQNAPGAAVLKAAGYQVPVSIAVGWSGVATLIGAPFGGFALNLAAITAAICAGREAHEDPGRRYVAAVTAGALYIAVGIFGATVASVFAAFPKELVAAIAGLALLGTIGNGLVSALKDEHDREAALITFLVTGSGVVLGGIGSAFWGIIAGVLAMLVLRKR